MTDTHPSFLKTLGILAMGVIVANGFVIVSWVWVNL